MTRRDSPCEGGIVLLAKPSSITSFAAIASLKKAFCGQGDEGKPRKKAARIKVGHTGTLDSFADGLLVVLTNKLTRLAPFIEALHKEYRAIVAFGAETDTLDPTGVVVKEAELPAAAAVIEAIPSFTGKIQQVPPEYSALKQGGVRLSDLARAGESVAPKAREVTIFQIDVERLASPDGSVASPDVFPASSPVAKAVLRVRCSKGTYIRALARDIAKKAGSAAHLLALRRLSVGPFLLEEAAGFSALKPFGFCRDNDADAGDMLPLPSLEEIRSKAMRFSPEIAEECGFGTLTLKKSALDAFCSGKPLSAQWFEDAPLEACASRMAVFCSGSFAGVIHAEGDKLVYDFVF